MKRAVLALTFAAFSVTLSSNAQTPSAQEPPAPASATTAETATDGASSDAEDAGGAKAFNFTFGPQEDGSLGAVLKGSRYYALGGRETQNNAGRSLLFSPFAGIDIDAGWSSADDATNNASISIKPSLAITAVGENDNGPTMSGPWLHLFLDGRERTGNFKQADESVKRINQTLYGGGIQWRWANYNERRNAWLETHGKPRPSNFDEIPRVTLTYYAVRDRGHDAIEAPADIEGNAFQLRTQADLTIPVRCTTSEKTLPPDPKDVFPRLQRITSCPWGFLADVAATRPTQGDNRNIEMFYDVGIYFNNGSDMKPIVRYRSGKEHGFTFDRQFILGLLLRLGS